MSLKNKIKMLSVSESGRSMVEMLGVLAIIGVLSIAGIAGYKFALNKFRANEIINELNARALSVSAQMLSATTPYESDEVIEDGFGNTLAVGYSAESAVSSQNPEYFEITINGIPSEVCTQILRDYENPIMIFVNEVRYNNDTSLCTTESGTVDMGFIYRRDLGERETCSEKGGYFDDFDFLCHCDENKGTAIDPTNPNECICAVDHIWSADANACIKSICKEEGYFESLTDGCVPCSDEKMYTIKGTAQEQLCKACGNRNVGSFNQTVYCYNMEKPACVLTEEFLGVQGTCKSCNSDDWYIYIFKTEDAKALCDQCPNRHASGIQCIKETCNTGMFVTLMHGCQYCSNATSYQIGGHQNEIDSCLACRNSEGVPNRKITGSGDYTYCTKSVCDSGEFMGADGQCYKCTVGKKVEVNSDSGCTVLSCNRSEVTDADGKTYCQIKNCPTDGTYAFVDGNCYACGGRNGDNSAFSATKAQCDQCTTPKRLWVGNYVDESTVGRCMWNCTYGEQIPLSDGQNLCYTSCGKNSGDGSTLSCGNEVCREYCEACDGHVVNGVCYSNTSCETGKQFRNPNSTYTFCVGCDVVEKKYIGSHELERKKCMDCTLAKRFWAGQYCYHWNTAETPDVLTEEEIQSCTLSGRTVVEGKCVRNQ